MKNIQATLDKNWDIAVVGAGMGSLTAACMHAKDGKRVLVLEQNYLPGGCVSSYYRKGYVFEAGATTLVGLDEHMPLKYLLDQIRVDIDALQLEIPMRVHLKNGQTLTRFQELDKWIGEAERVFGAKNQRAFWEHCYDVSQFVWESSLKQLAFPPTRIADLGVLLRNFEVRQLKYAVTAFTSMRALLKKFDLLDNALFVDFVNEQLLITAQNHIGEVNVLFGGTALCYTNFGNYYVKGGLINLVQPLCDYIEERGGAVLTRVGVDRIRKNGESYELQTTRKGEGRTVKAQQIISGIPINNTLEIYAEPRLERKYKHSTMPSQKLVSAFGMGIGFTSKQRFDCIHHQIHLQNPLPIIGSASIFLSLNHPSDTSRTPNKSPKGYEYVANISTHVFDPVNNYQFDKTKIEEAVFEALAASGFLKREDVRYYHSFMPSSWENWIGRKYGFVGGYPQYFNIKPWQMLDARLDGKGAYICGDTTYPGQGIPGTALSGLIAYQKMKLDGV